jgi:hypothetical protein
MPVSVLHTFEAGPGGEVLVKPEAFPAPELIVDVFLFTSFHHNPFRIPAGMIFIHNTFHL